MYWEIDIIKQNKNVCVSFIDVLVHKGFQLKGTAEIIIWSDTDFIDMKINLEKLTEGKFPFSSIIKITVEYTKPIIAPRYLFYPETTEEEQVKSARKSYGL